MTPSPARALAEGHSADPDVGLGNGRGDHGLVHDLAYDPGGGFGESGDALSRGLAMVAAQNELDWALVAALRAQASEQLEAALRSQGSRLDRTGEQELGRAIIMDLLQADAAEAVSAGRRPASPAGQAALARAVFDALFGLGRLQPLVDDDRVENIVCNGADHVWLDLTDGSRLRGPVVADSDAELVDFLGFVASRSEVNARPFSPARPLLHLRLDGGARLAAAAWVTPRPSVVIRRHRLRRVSIADLVARQTLSPVAGTLLSAAIKARKSVVVAGPQGAGKTTLVRALCGEIPRHEAIGTFETEYELHLHELPEQHEIVHAFEARPGSGERDGAGRQAGEVTLAELLDASFRFNLSRQIVGEVRGSEVWSMIKAMESGSGSISTTHAADAAAAISKLESCAMEAGVAQEVATRKLAQTIHLIVQLHLETTETAPGAWSRRRWVSEILLVEPSDEVKGYATTAVFRPAHGRAAVAGTIPDSFAQELRPHGFDYGGFLAESDAHRDVAHPVVPAGPTAGMAAGLTAGVRK